jgi:hypothetical protein
VLTFGFCNYDKFVGKFEKEMPDRSKIYKIEEEELEKKIN